MRAETNIHMTSAQKRVLLIALVTEIAVSEFENTLMLF